MTTRRDHPSEAEAITAAAIEMGVPTLAAAEGLMERFHRMFRGRDTGVLTTWISDASASLLASFGKGIVAATAAVKATLIEPRPNGQTRLDLLRARLQSDLSEAQLHRE